MCSGCFLSRFFICIGKGHLYCIYKNHPIPSLTHNTVYLIVTAQVLHPMFSQTPLFRCLTGSDILQCVKAGQILDFTL